MPALSHMRPDAALKTFPVSFANISTGKAVIDGAIKPAVNTSNSGGRFQSNDRKFSDESLEGY